MNKTQLVDAVAARIGDRRTAATAVDGLLDTIVDTVGAGESVSITGFGVFESRARAARVARNPRTGEAVEVPATTVPAFRAGAGFRTKVGGGEPPAPRSTPARHARATPVADASPAAGVPKPTRLSTKKAATPEPATPEPATPEPEVRAGKSGKAGSKGKAANQAGGEKGSKKKSKN